jgi:hypothetical protein
VRESENLNLCRSPTEQEIKDALFDIPINSSPSPDGFTYGFFQHCWDFIQTDLIEAFRDFFCGYGVFEVFHRFLSCFDSESAGPMFL